MDAAVAVSSPPVYRGARWLSSDTVFRWALGQNTCRASGGGPYCDRMSDSENGSGDGALTRILESAKNQLEQMIDLHPQGMLLLDSEGCVARCNDSFIEILGKSCFTQVLGRPVTELLNGDDPGLTTLLEQQSTSSPGSHPA